MLKDRHNGAPPLYKFVFQCQIGENNGQMIRSASRCLWDKEIDNSATASWTNVPPPFQPHSCPLSLPLTPTLSSPPPLRRPAPACLPSPCAERLARPSRHRAACGPSRRALRCILAKRCRWAYVSGSPGSPLFYRAGHATRWGSADTPDRTRRSPRHRSGEAAAPTAGFHTSKGRRAEPRGPVAFHATCIPLLTFP